MVNKREIILAFVAVAILVSFVAIGFHTSKPSTTTPQLPWPSQESEQVKLDEKNNHYAISAVYPKTSSDVITMYFKSYVDEQVSQFKDDTSWVNDVSSSSDGILTLDISYSTLSSSHVQNYIFSVNSYTGGAHGLQARKTFSFNKEGQLLTISNLFSNGFDGLPVFTKIVQKELLKRDGADEKWITDGAGPKEENYHSFVVTNNGVTILFDPYQVAPYSDGAIDIEIPFTAFAKIANPEIFSVAASR